MWKPVWQFFGKLKIESPYDPEILHMDIYSRELKTFVHKRNLHTNIYSSIIYKSQKVETPQVPTNRCKVKQNVGYSYNRNITPL